MSSQGLPQPTSLRQSSKTVRTDSHLEPAQNFTYDQLTFLCLGFNSDSDYKQSEIRLEQGGPPSKATAGSNATCETQVSLTSSALIICLIDTPRRLQGWVGSQDNIRWSEEKTMEAMEEEAMEKKSDANEGRQQSYRGGR
ncbi:MAG: hypothetical protein Q9166_007312 [cf. Caloplaca sp. 2 TL-2023]